MFEHFVIDRVKSKKAADTKFLIEGMLLYIMTYIWNT